MKPAGVPVVVWRVPEVGRVTPVVLLAVNVIAYAPDVIREPPSATVRVDPVAGAVIVTLLYVPPETVPRPEVLPESSIVTAEV
jgi:hypothetical protein